MLTIENGVNISYTLGDTFELKVNAKNGFTENSTLRFVIAQNQTAEPLIKNTYNIQDGAFYVTLSQTDKEKLEINDYIYKLTLIGADGTIVTQKSGDFFVKWGA